MSDSLYDAATKGDADRVRALLRSGVDPAIRSVDGISPLGAAIRNGHRPVLLALLEAGVDPNAPAVKDEPALFAAAARSRPSMIRDLVAAGAETGFAHPAMGSALTAAIIRKDDATLEELLRAGVPIGVRNSGGAQDLHVAAMTGNRTIVQRLIDNDADIHSANFQGGTPLRSAAANGHSDLVRLFLELGADPAPVDAFGKRPVDYAEEAGHEDVVRLLADAHRPDPAPCIAITRNPLAVMLPCRQDATLRMVIHAREHGHKIRTCAATSLEAPSMIAVSRSLLGPGFKVAFTVNGGPDPRLPVRKVAFVLWSYEQSGALTLEAHEAVDRPAERIIQVVARLAEYPYLLRAWSRAAARAAERLTADHRHEVLAVMVYPPAAPKYIEPWDWCLRVQVAAALIASHLGAEPWAQCPRRDALETVVDGPVDWAVTAAIIALLDVARRDATARPGIVSTLLQVARRPLTPPAYQHAIRPAALALLEIGGLSGDLSSELEDLVSAGSD